MKRLKNKFKQCASALLLVATLNTPVVSHALLFDLLNAAVLGVDWIASNASRAQITGLNELRLYNGYVEVESQVYDFSEADEVTLNFDVTVPFSIAFGIFGAGPNPGEDLRVDYLTNTGSWQEITTFVADNGFLGLISLGGVYSYSGTLPASAHHDNFQVRYVMEGGGFSFFDLLGDNWYVSNIEVDADLPPTGPDHFRMSYSSAALTCNPHAVTIQACADAACSSLYTDSVTTTLSPSGWSGGDTITFSGGSATASLVKTTPGTVAVGVSVAVPPVTGGATQCSISGSGYSAFCNLTYADSGFIVSVPEFISGRGETASIQAVKKDDASQQCTPAFSNVTKTLDFWSGYNTPSSGTLPVYVGSPASAMGGSSGTASSTSVSFNASGVASVAVNYFDAGDVELNVNYTGSGADAGLSMTGNSNFIARPVGMCVRTGGECTNPAGGDYANCGVFTQAGAEFSLNVSAVAWESDSDSDFCTDNAATPNYTSNGGSVQLGVSVVSPSGSGSLDGVVHLEGAPSSTSYIQTSNSQDVSVNQTEVGVFNFSVTPPLYFGSALGTVGNTSLATFASKPTGRFTPDHFDIVINDNGSLATIPGCIAGNLYSGQPTTWMVAPEVYISAHSANHDVTQNYTQTGYRKLNAASVFAGISAPTSDTTKEGTDNNLLAVDVNLVEGTLNNRAGHPGEMTYVFSAADDITYVRSALAEVDPFAPELTFDLLATLEDSDEVKIDLAESFIPSSSGLSVRYGRFWLEDIYGPDVVNLIMPLRTEYFDGSGYVVNPLDDCTTWADTNASIDSISTVLTSSGSLTDGTSGDVGLILEASSVTPGTPDEGDATVTYSAPTWLQGDYDNNGSYENPQGAATFGVNRGHERLIYRKELR